jgi:hypothetical protein
MNCLNGYFHDVFTNSISEALIRNPNGGAIAVWASSGFTETNRQTGLDQELTNLLFNDETLTLGEAVRKSKETVFNNDVRRTWILFGDPVTALSR